MTEENIKVRLATLADLEDIVGLGRLLAAENGVGDLNEDKVRIKVRQAVDRKPNDARPPSICGVIGEPKTLTGMIYLEVGTLWYNDDIGLHEMWNFVHPEYRKSQRAKHLVEFAKQCAKNLDLPLHIGIISNQRTEAKVRLYDRLLGTTARVGAFFLWNGHTGKKETA